VLWFSRNQSDQAVYPDLLDFCLDKIDDPTQDQPQIVFKWYSSDPTTGELMVSCTDTLTTICESPDENVCLEIFDQTLECLQDSSKYRYTFTVVNKSNPAFNADRLHLTIKNDPVNFGVVPTGPIIPLSTPLASGDTLTYSTCIASTIFPATIPDLVFGYRLQNSQSGDCCYESVCDTIETPTCPVECCTDFDAFCDLVDSGFQTILNEDCSITIDATQFDSCHWYGTPVPDWGDGSISTQVITSAVGAGPWMHTYNNPGTYNICITVFEGDDIEDTCWEKQMCTEVIIECPCGPDGEPEECLNISNVEVKDLNCEVDDCYLNPFCQVRLRTLMDNSTNQGCQPITDYSRFDRGIWSGQTVFIGYTNGAPDGGSEDIYSCDGTLLQSCVAGIGIVCSPDANIDVTTDVKLTQTIWNCGDTIDPIETCNTTQCLDYDEPYCSPWLIDVIDSLATISCPTICTYDVELARWNGSPIVIVNSLCLDTEGEDIYDCNGTLIQSCTIQLSVGRTCTIGGSIDTATDLTDEAPLWQCSDATPMLDSTCPVGNACISYCFDLENTGSQLVSSVTYL